MKPEDLEKIGKIHEQYKSVSKDCADLYILSEKLSDKKDSTLHVCLNQGGHVEIPPVRVANMSNIAETIVGIMKEVREGNHSAHVDLNNSESLEVIRLILKIKSAQKARLAEELKELGVDIL